LLRESPHGKENTDSSRSRRNAIKKKPIREPVAKKPPTAEKKNIPMSSILTNSDA
jgi:hypothetical protein